MSLREPFKLKLAKIRKIERLRPVDMAKAETLAISMKEQGQIHPIEVRLDPADSTFFILVTGAHRQAAAEMNGWDELDAVQFDGSADDARLREIDENLYRAELNPFDQANFINERREIWERLHGEVRRGGDRRSKGQIVPLKEALGQSGFIAETAKRFGLHEKTVKRALTRRAQIAPAIWSALRDTDASKNAALLDKLRKLTIEEQQEVLTKFKERGCAFVEAVRIVTHVPPQEPEIMQFDALRRAWAKAGEPARKKFIKEIGRVK